MTSFEQALNENLDAFKGLLAAMDNLLHVQGNAIDKMAKKVDWLEAMARKGCDIPKEQFGLEDSCNTCAIDA